MCRKCFLNKIVLWMDKTDLIHGKGQDYFSPFVAMYIAMYVLEKEHSYCKIKT